MLGYSDARMLNLGRSDARALGFSYAQTLRRLDPRTLGHSDIRILGYLDAQTRALRHSN